MAVYVLPAGVLLVTAPRFFCTATRQTISLKANHVRRITTYTTDQKKTRKEISKRRAKILRAVALSIDVDFCGVWF
jgi:hypothetical protein